MPLEMKRLLSVHIHFLVVVRVRYSVSQFTVRNFEEKIRAIYILRNVHHGSRSIFSPISTNS